MTVSGSSLGFTILRLASENAVESSEANRLAARAMRKSAESAAENVVAQKEMANDKAAAQGWASVAQDVASVGMATVGVGKAANDVSEGQRAKSDLNAEIRSERTRDTRSTEGASGMDGIMNVDLGDGKRVGQRFSREQVTQLVDGEFTEASLREAGFTPDETRQLMRMRGDRTKLPTQEAVDWMVSNRLTESERNAQFVKDKLPGAIISVLKQSFDHNMANAQEEAREGAKKTKQNGQQLREVGEELAQSTLDHNEALGQAMTELIRGRRDLGAS